MLEHVKEWYFVVGSRLRYSRQARHAATAPRSAIGNLFSTRSSCLHTRVDAKLNSAPLHWRLVSMNFYKTPSLSCHSV